MAVFYYFLFGMMLSDAGYGLLMVIGCGVALAKFKNMEESLRKFLKMFCTAAFQRFSGARCSAASSATP